MTNNDFNSLVSIIIPVFNTEKYVEKAIESAISQKYKNIEVIIVDDASTDNSARIIEKYKRIDNRISVIVHAQNKGLGASRNDGIKHANGDYICFLDSDDYISDSLVQECLKVCEGSQLEILMYDATPLIEDGMDKHNINMCNYDRSEIIKNMSITDGYSFVTEYANNGGVLMSSCLMFINRDFLMNNGIIFMEREYYEDSKFHFDCMIHAKKISYISKKYYKRFYRDGSIMMSCLSKKNFISAFKVAQGMTTTFSKSINKKSDNTRWLSYLLLRIKSCINHVFSQVNSQNIAKCMEYYDSIIVMHCELIETLLEIFYVCKISQEDSLFNSLYELTYHVISAFDYLPVRITELIEKIRCYRQWYIYRTVSDLNLMEKKDAKVGIYGAGKYAEYIYNSFLREGGCVKADIIFIQSSCEKNGETFLGKRVVCIKDIKKENLDAIIVMSTKYNDEMIVAAKANYDGPIYSIYTLMGAAMDIHGEEDIDWLTRIYDISETSINEHTPRVVLLNTPEHNNIGDYMITEITKKLFGEYLPEKEVVYISQNQIEKNWASVCTEIRLNDFIIINGGGSLGMLWSSGKAILSILEKFRKNKIVIFPQTMYFADTALKDSWILRYQNAVKSCVDITICLREQISYGRAKEIFDEHTKIYIFPDVALMIPPQIFERERNGAIFALRNDIEGMTTDDDKERLKQILMGKFNSVRIGSMRYERNMFEKAGLAVIKRKLSEISSAELVVTDALHMVISCALTGTPCLAIDNLTGKVGGVYEWIKSLEYIHFFSAVEEAMEFDINHWDALGRKWHYSLDFSIQEKELMRLVENN